MAKIRNKEIYAEQVPVHPDDYVIGTRNSDGKTKNFSISGIAAAIADFLGITNFGTRLISVEDIVQDLLDITVINAVWKINFTEYSVASQDHTIEAATEDYYRTDYIIGSTNGQESVLQGVEDAVNAVAPLLPPNTVVIAVINVFGSEITISPEPVNGYRKKADEGTFDIYSTGVRDATEWDNVNTFRWLGNRNLRILSLDQVPTEMFNGRNFYFINASKLGALATLEHLSPSSAGNTLFFNPKLQDIVVQPGYIAMFRYHAENVSTGRLELVSLMDSSASTGASYVVFLANEDGISFTLPVLIGSTSVDMISSQVNGNVTGDFTFNSSTGTVSNYQFFKGEKHIVFYTA